MVLEDLQGVSQNQRYIPVWGLPMVRVIIFWGLYWGPYFGKLPHDVTWVRLGFDLSGLRGQEVPENGFGTGPTVDAEILHDLIVPLK